MKMKEELFEILRDRMLKIEFYSRIIDVFWLKCVAYSDLSRVASKLLIPFAHLTYVKLINIKTKQLSNFLTE